MKAVLVAWGQNKYNELGVGAVKVGRSQEAFVKTPTLVHLRREPEFIGSGAEHTVCVTTTNKVLMCGLNIGNRFCEGDLHANSQNNQLIGTSFNNGAANVKSQKIVVKRFKSIKKDLLNQK